MKKIFHKIKSLIKKSIKKMTPKPILLIFQLERRVSQLEEIVHTQNIGLQVNNGLSYLEHIRSTKTKDNDPNLRQDTLNG